MMIKRQVIQCVLFGIVTLGTALTLNACTKSETQPGAGSGQATTPANIVLAKPDPTGKMKCPNGDDAVKVKGPCPGTWHFEKKTGPKGEVKHVCQFVYESSVTCKKKGYAENGREACYGGAFIVDADANITSDSECQNKFHGSWNATYEFDCCK
jgi:hypothetical protein